MRQRPDQLEATLRRQGLAPLYLVFGDEPLQILECCDLLRRQARGAGFEERVVLNVEAGFDWQSLGAEAGALSLFASRRLIEVRLGEAKPGTEGAKALAAYAAAPPPDTLLLVSAGRIDRQSQQSKWFKALEQAGVAVQSRPVEAARLPGWLAARARSLGLGLSPAAAELIADRVEGNLLAADQELRRLALLYGDQAVDSEQVLAAVADNARYDLFDYIDCTLTGDGARSLRMLRGLEAEGTEAVVVCWGLSRELRSLCLMAAERAGGAAWEPLFARHRIWDKRRRPVQAALERHRLPVLRRLLREAGRIDRVIKGAAEGRPWDDLARLSLALGRGFELGAGGGIPADA